MMTEVHAKPAKTMSNDMPLTKTAAKKKGLRRL